jgi:alpha-L-fucosidase
MSLHRLSTTTLSLLAVLVMAGRLLAVDPPAPRKIVPSPGQCKWQEMEIISLVHYGLNTYIGQEWGYGDTPAAAFNPDKLDTDQWVEVCRSAGIRGIILVAKHHDGFCLWPSKYTEYSVKASPWKDGKGDLVGDLSESCRKGGLKFGIYLSPWDRNHAEYARPAYVEYYYNQWVEVLSNYGPIFEIWFDGANGGTGYYGGAREKRAISKDYYNYPRILALLKEKHPDAIAFNYRGPQSSRWPGNEHGDAGDPNWCTIKREDDPDGGYWSPAEADTPAIGRWFWKPRGKVDSLEQLVNKYFTSVGRGGVLNFGLAPATSGLIDPKDAERLKQFGAYLRAMHKTDFAEGKKATATQTRGGPENAAFGAANLLDGDPATYWTTDDAVTTADIEIDLGRNVTFNVVSASEFIKLGQRIKSWEVEAFHAGKWEPIAKGTTVGYKRLIRIPDTTASKIRVGILDSFECPMLHSVNLYYAPD